MTSLDLTTKTGVLRFCELRRAEMVGCFATLGRYECNGFSFAAYLFATHEVISGGADLPWRTGPKLPRVTAEECRMPESLHGILAPEQETEAFAFTLREMAKMSRAIGSLVMTEMWHVVVQRKEGQSASEVRSELPDRLEDYAGRREVLYMQLEHPATGRRMWLAEILREPTRLLPWREREPGDATGRLVDIAGWRS